MKFLIDTLPGTIVIQKIFKININIKKPIYTITYSKCAFNFFYYILVMHGRICYSHPNLGRNDKINGKYI